MCPDVLPAHASSTNKSFATIVFGFLRGMVVLLVVATVFALTLLAKSAGWQALHGAVWLKNARKFACVASSA